MLDYIRRSHREVSCFLSPKASALSFLDIFQDLVPH